MHKKNIKGTTYYYTNVRENGKVKTIYLGRTGEEAVRREIKLKASRERPFGLSVIRTRLLIFVILILVVFGGVFLFRGAIVGYFTAGITGEENLTVEFVFQSQDFLPKDTVIEISLEDQSSSLTLEEFVDKSGSDLKLKTGNFHSSGTDLSGFGVGYGLGDGKNSYPDVSFQFILNAYASEDKEIPGEKLVFLGFKIINGTCNFNRPFHSNIGDLIEQENAKSYSVNLIPGSVMSNNKTLDDSYVSLELNRDVVTAETDYFESLNGFGGDRTISLDLSELGIFLPEDPGGYELRMRVVYDEHALKEISKNIIVSESILADSGDWI